MRIGSSTIVDELTYSSYAHNRRISPHISPERWMHVFGPEVQELEMRFQAEKSGGLSHERD
jgi:hypothetical protein